MKLLRVILRPLAMGLWRYFVPLLLLPVALPLSAQQEGAAPPRQGYPVRGTVVNSLTNQPIARALVTLQGGAQDATLTNSEGQFEFANVSAGFCLITAIRPGFFGSRQSPAPGAVRIQVGPSLTEITVSLLPTGSISGQVTLSNSDSAENIQVYLLRRMIDNGRATWVQSEVRSANSDGIYLFGNLAPGVYRVFTAGSVDPVPEAAHNQERWGFPPEYILGGGDVADNTALTLRPGQRLQADITLTHEPFYSVTVSVANASRRGGVNVQVYDPAGHMLPYPTHYDPRQQLVSLSLPKGRYMLEGQSFGATPMSGSREIAVQNAPVSLDLTLLPLNPIAVTIRREFTAQNGAQSGVASGSLDGQSEATSAGVNLTLRPVAGNGRAFGGGNLRRALNGSDNSSYVLENVRPGTYWVQGFAFQGYIASITSGGVDLAKTPLVVGAGDTSPPIEIMLRNDGASLSVSLNQAASTNVSQTAYVSLVPQFEKPGQLPDHIQISQNVTQISNLPPGTYRVLAFDEPQQLEYMNPQTMSAFAGKGQTVTLEAGGSAKVSLDVISTDSQSP